MSWNRLAVVDLFHQDFNAINFQDQQNVPVDHVAEVDLHVRVGPGTYFFRAKKRPAHAAVIVVDFKHAVCFSADNVQFKQIG